jgi:Putative auto-transporter adhesin, head GIN domain
MNRTSGGLCGRIYAALLVALVLPMALALPQTAHAEKRKLLVGSFQDVTVYGDMQVEIVTGKAPTASATGDRATLDLLRLERDSEHLIIRVQQTPLDSNRTRITQPLVIYLGTRQLRNISLSGNARLHITNIRRDGISRIIVDGGGNIDIDALNTDKIDAAISGTGRIGIGKGAARETSLRIQGAGIYDAQNLLTRKFMLEQNGNATVNVRAEENATISNIGSGNITVIGNAECFIRKAGAAIISCPQDSKATQGRQPIPIATKAK